MPPKWAHFECEFSTPTLTRKTENNQKTKSYVHNYNVFCIQLIWFDSLALALSDPLSWKPKPEKNFKESNL